MASGVLAGGTAVPLGAMVAVFAGGGSVPTGAPGGSDGSVVVVSAVWAEGLAAQQRAKIVRTSGRHQRRMAREVRRDTAPFCNESCSTHDLCRLPQSVPLAVQRLGGRELSLAEDLAQP